MSFIAVIPARSGSKGVQHKNVVELNGEPLLVHSVKQGVCGKRGGLLDEVYISTDSPEYEEIGVGSGARSLGLRDGRAATDGARDEDWIRDFLRKWKDGGCGGDGGDGECVYPDWIVQLRPTYPFRDIGLLRECVEYCRRNPGIGVLRTVVPIEKSPCKMQFMDGDGVDGYDRLRPCVNEGVSGVGSHWEAPRQVLPQAYLHDGCIDVINVRRFMECDSMPSAGGGEVRGLVNKQEAKSRDIDAAEDIWMTELMNVVNGLNVWKGGRTIYVDIDGTLTEPLPEGAGLDYSHAVPNMERIRVLNELAEAGNRVTLYTARGTVTGRDWRECTMRQMKIWGVHPSIYLRLKKPAWDVLIDDKVLHCSALDYLKVKRG